MYLTCIFSLKLLTEHFRSLAVFAFLSLSLFLSMHTSAQSELSKGNNVHYDYKTIQGFFLQSERETVSKGFDFVRITGLPSKFVNMLTES